MKELRFKEEKLARKGSLSSVPAPILSFTYVHHIHESALSSHTDTHTHTHTHFEPNGTLLPRRLQNCCVRLEEKVQQ